MLLIKKHIVKGTLPNIFRRHIWWIWLAVAGCAAPPAADATAAAAEIQTLLTRQVAGWNAGDIAGFMAPYWHSDSLRFASGGRVTYGWQATYERYSRRYQSRAEMGQLIFSDVDITLISPEAALVFGKWRLQREADTPRGLFTLLLRKSGGEWVIVHDHTSSGTGAP